MVEISPYPRDVAIGGAAHPAAGVAVDPSAEVVVEAVEVEFEDTSGHLLHDGGREWDLVRETAHERNPVLIRSAGDRVSAEQHALAVGRNETSHGTPREMSADPV